MELVHSETDIQGIKYLLYIEPDETEVRGNALASGDDDEDAAYEDDLLERLGNGDVWAWALTKVVASFEGFKGVDYLGGCSYRDTEDFIASGGYWKDMKATAKEALLLTLQKACHAHKLLAE